MNVKPGGCGLSCEAAAALVLEVDEKSRRHIAALLAVEAEVVERAEATSDPNEPLPRHVKVTRGRSPRADGD